MAKKARTALTEPVRVTQRERERLRVLSLRERRAKPTPPAPWLLMISADEIPGEDCRGEWTWSDPAGARTHTLFYEVTRIPCEDGRIQLDLDLYGQPIGQINTAIRFWTPKKALWCTHCSRFKASLFFYLRRLGLCADAWCSTCFYHGTPREHDFIRHGADSDPWGPVKWPSQWYGKQEPLRLQRPRLLKGGAR